MKQRLIIAIMICLAFLLPSCQSSSRAASTVVSPVSATAGLSPKPSLTLTQRPTETETPSPSLTFTSTPTPTVTPTPIAMPHLRVVYFYNGEFWTVEPPAPPVQLPIKLEENNGSAFNVLLSSDGNKIILLEVGGPGISVGVRGINFDGSGYRTLLTRAQVSKLELILGDPASSTVIQQIDWIPGTHRMVFTTAEPAAQIGYVSHGNLFETDADSGLFFRIFKRGEPGYAVPSPNGRKLAIIKICTIALNSIDGTSLFKDVIPKTPDCYEWHYPKVVWAEDSSHFGVIMPFQSAGATIFLVDSSTGVASALGTITNILSGVLSPTLDYVGGVTPFGKYPYTMEPYIYGIDGSVLMQLSNKPGGFISFAPNGRHFIYFVGCMQSYGCPSDSPDPKVFVGSLDGTSFLVPGAYSLNWINDMQFVYIAGKSLRLGDIGGNSIEIANAEYCYYFDAKDLGFQAGE